MFTRRRPRERPNTVVRLFSDGTRAAASHPAVESAARSPRPSIVADVAVFEIERAAN